MNRRGIGQMSVNSSKALEEGTLKIFKGTMKIEAIDWRTIIQQVPSIEPPS